MIGNGRPQDQSEHQILSEEIQIASNFLGAQGAPHDLGALHGCLDVGIPRDVTSGKVQAGLAVRQLG